MRIRAPSWAGLFYPAVPDACRRQLDAFLDLARTFPSEQRGPVMGGVVPHAGWTYSGGVAARLYQALSEMSQPDCIMLFGAWHRVRGPRAILCGADLWRTPLGDLVIDADFADAARADAEMFVTDLQASEAEHSLEVQGPFLARCLTDVPVFPVLVPPSPLALDIGRRLGRCAVELKKRVMVLASTDLTHYGPRYGFMPHGRGPRGVRWAKEDNDRRMIDLMIQLKEDQIVPESRVHLNACGPGAVAAAMAAAKILGMTSASVLQHTNSAETTGDPNSEDAVGYVAIAFHAGAPGS